MLRQRKVFVIENPVSREHYRPDIKLGSSIPRPRTTEKPHGRRDLEHELSVSLRAVDDLKDKIKDLRRENDDLRQSLMANIKQSSSEVIQRISEKRRNEKLVKEVDTLHRCCSSLMDETENKRPISNSANADMRRMIVELMRSNQSLYRHAVFSTKQRVLTEQKLKRSSSASSLSGRSTPKKSPISIPPTTPDYEPLIPNASPLDKDFATYLTVTQGELPRDFLNQFRDVSEPEGVASGLVEFISKEFVQLAAWNKRVEAIVSEIEYLNSLATTSVDSTLVAITETIKKSIHCDRASIWMIDHSGSNEAWTRRLIDASAGKAQYQELRIPIGAGLVGCCFESKEIVNIRDAYADPRFDQRTDKTTGYRTKSVMCVPIMKRTSAGERVISVIQAINKSHDQSFSKQDEIVINMFGSVASSVVNHCELLAAQDLAAVRTDVVMDGVHAVAELGTVTAQEIVKLVKRTLHRLFRAVDCSVTLVNSDHTFERMHIDEANFHFDRLVTPQSPSLCLTATETQAPVSTTSRDVLHPQIDIPLGDDGVVHAVPFIQNGLTLFVIQFVTAEPGHFSIQSSHKILNQFLICVLPFVKRAVAH